MSAPLHDVPLIIFDLDGTVVDTLDLTVRCFQEAVAPGLGRVPDRAEVLARFGPADQHIVAEWVGPGHAEDAVQRLYACYDRELTGAGPFPGMRELLEDLRRAGRTTALFTGRGRPSTDVILQAMDLAGHFGCTVTGEEIPHPKPAPDGLLRVLALCRRSPAEAVYVGDSPLDEQAARDAGMRAVSARWSGHPRDEADGGEAVVADTVDDLRRLLLP